MINMEFEINKLILFDKGYIIETTSPLNLFATYYLSVKPSSSIEINKTYYITKNTSMIIDLLPQTLNENVCFTLTDGVTPPICQTPTCSFEVI